MEKTGPGFVTTGEIFTWQIDYVNDSGNDDDLLRIVDTLPVGIQFLNATHA